jgi:hypothetical protein
MSDGAEIGFGFLVGICCACVVGVIVSEKRRPDIKHPPIPVRVLAKTEIRPREGRTSYELQFGAGGFIGSVYVDRTAFDAASHWSCVAVRFNQDQDAWEYVGTSTRCDP